MKPIKNITLGTALLALGVGSAHADSFATSALNITNFIWCSGTTAAGVCTTATALTNGNEITIATGAANNASATANVGAQSASIAPATPIGQISHNGGAIPLAGVYNTGAVTPLAPSNGGLAPAQPLPGGAGQPAGQTDTTTYGYAEYSLAGAVVNIPVTGSPAIPAGVTAHTLAQGSTVTNDQAGSSATLGTNATIRGTFTANQTLATHFSMNYSVNMLAQIINPFGLTDNAKATATWSLSITDLNNGDSFFWQPSDLNHSRDPAVTGGSILKTRTYANSVTGFLTGSDMVLTQGHQYQFVVDSAITSVVFKNVVPEPTSLSLFAIGLLGYSASKRRKIKSTI